MKFNCNLLLHYLGKCIPFIQFIFIINFLSLLGYWIVRTTTIIRSGIICFFDITNYLHEHKKSARRADCNFYLTKCTNKCTIRYIIIFTTKPTARGDIMNKPLADRIRPKTIDDIVGQKHLIAPDRPLRKIIESGDIPNLIFYGPSGVGKTTLATYIAKKTNRTLKKLNGTTASTADIKEIVAQLNTFSGLNGILLYLDEIQYFNKKQQQTLLEYIENGSITLIASTTENPYFYVYNAILSRSTVFEFKPRLKRRFTVQVIFLPRRAVRILKCPKNVQRK